MRANAVIRVKLGVRIIGRDGHVVRATGRWESLTNYGLDYIVGLMGSSTANPIATIGIGWGTGANNPFQPGQTALQGQFTETKPVTFTKEVQVGYGLFHAVYGANDPSTSVIYIGEIGIFDTLGNLVDRTVITPTPKLPFEVADAYCEVQFRLP